MGPSTWHRSAWVVGCTRGVKCAWSAGPGSPPTNPDPIAVIRLPSGQCVLLCGWGCFDLMELQGLPPTAGQYGMPAGRVPVYYPAMDPHRMGSGKGPQ